MSKRLTKGFTLIEAVIYIALFSIVITGIMLSAFSIIESSGRNQTKAMVQEEKAFLLAKINWSLSGVQSVSVPANNTNAPSLTLIKYDGVPVTLSLSGTNLQLATSGPTVVLNNSNVFVSNLLFIHRYTNATSPESIEAGFTVSARTPNGMMITQTASTTSYIRK